MAKIYKYIRIEEISQKPKTSVYTVFNSKDGSYLGTIEWYGPWREYCFMPTIDCVFCSQCLTDIIDFIKNHARRGGATIVKKTE